MQIIYKIEFILMKKIIIFWKKIRFLENKFIFWKFIFLGNKISFFGRKKNHIFVKIVPNKKFSSIFNREIPVKISPTIIKL